MEYVQMSLFDLLKNEPDVLLGAGQRVYVVSRADVYEYNVENNYLVDSAPDDRYYTLKHINRNTYATTCNSQLDRTLFLSREEAAEKARNYEGQVWRSSSIAFKEAGLWEGIRKSDAHHMKAWYGIVPGPLGADSGFLVIKTPMSFIHAVDYGSEKKARKYIENVFIPECDKYGLAKKDNCGNIDFCNLYPCKDSVDWDWAEDGYSGIKDYELKKEEKNENV